MFAPGGAFTKSQVRFAFNVSILIRMGAIHLSGSTDMACWYECGMLWEAFVSVRHAI